MASPSIIYVYEDTLIIARTKTLREGPGEYGSIHSERYPACIYRRKLVLVKIKPMYETLKKSLKVKYSLEQLHQSEFGESLLNPDSRLVLAPNRYRFNSGMFTAFNEEKIVEMMPEFKDVINRLRTPK